MELTFECPFCRHLVVKSGNWFKSTSMYNCQGCKKEVRLTYADKAALFDRHRHMV